MREAWEELGIDPGQVDTVTLLTPVWIPVSRFHVLPVVGLTTRRPTFSLATSEVAILIEASLHDLMQSEVARSTTRTIRGRNFTVPYFAVGEHVVWGATAIILAQLVNRLREVGVRD
ncbi:MAG: hypothetical protein NVS2B7_40740 [Herpetosiphon sp.]